MEGRRGKERERGRAGERRGREGKRKRERGVQNAYPQHLQLQCRVIRKLS